jgi:NAD(P)-dependent dehydrogenase (short-subunit alcohol dehydrogenase family)
MANKIALITGASRGLGKEMALAFAQKGIDVILTYKSKEDEAQQVGEEIAKLGRKAAVLKLDVGDLKSFNDFFMQVSLRLQSVFGAERFDYLVNNGGHGATIPFAQVTEDAFDNLLNVHFKGVYFFTQKAVSLMNDNGSIVNISTGTTRFCVPGYSAYASMKGAIETFTRYLAKELGPRGITANVLAPGPIETDFNNAAIRSHPERKAMLTAQTALGRVGQASDIGGIVALLCSPEAHWINAQRIEASGGINL